ncbi:SDR family oxidoreductase [Candidatus Nitronereus thalassa]|uniref:SDR family NAD(P)-dependent oxidoreductase n=1 Tax=Candidatus Nitronereus thalassa TaxID=3020898 RepID=A0ABU3K486_9BACT|nr:SDR family oxidoreductase [Candidatus Nitronereus thalassa]MDT7041217.1 SDR family NAD(P)-dependent oxidoreductase [Candidatus Nitronereus thalassa]
MGVMPAEAETTALRNTVLIVTGGSRGIGRAIVRLALERGARVVFCSRRHDEEVETLLAEIDRRFEGLGCHVQADVGKESDVQVLFDYTAQRFGPPDVVIHNAAVSQAARVVTMTTAQWDEVMTTNLTSAFLMGREAIRSFLREGRVGRLIMLGSITQGGAPSNISYATSKGGLVGFTRTVTHLYGHQGIRANVVVGGYVKTRLTEDVPFSIQQGLIETCPEKRAGTPDEIANAVLFLAGAPLRTWPRNPVYVSGGALEFSL